MASLTKCDGCGIISPNDEGLRIANHWIRIEVRPANGGRAQTRNYILCLTCMGVVKDQPPAFAWFAHLKNELLCWFAKRRKPLEPEDGDQ